MGLSPRYRTPAEHRAVQARPARSWHLLCFLCEALPAIPDVGLCDPCHERLRSET